MPESLEDIKQERAWLKLMTFGIRYSPKPPSPTEYYWLARFSLLSEQLIRARKGNS